MENRRGLSHSFIDALKSHAGLGLSRFVDAIKQDQTLDLEIRNDYINIYYRGGNLIKLEENRDKYIASFDRKYILTPTNTRLPIKIGNQVLEGYPDVSAWIDAIPDIKLEMDHWFSVHPKNEREFQQLIVRENNFSRTAKGTDYFICDIEYSSVHGRFDLIAANWPSSSARRKDNQNVGLAFIEMKYMDNAMRGESGILPHIRDMVDYYSDSRNKDNFASLKQEMCTVFKQKFELGLIDNQKPIERFNDKIPAFILIFANHDPDSEILDRELDSIQGVAATSPFTIKIAVSNFMGYGLYEQNIFGLEEFRSRYSKQIYAKQ